MGKIVKYCSSCDEGFAEKFGFCPDCGAPLQAFEMNPVDGESSEKMAAAKVENIEPPIPEFIAETVYDEPVAVEAADADFDAPEIAEPEEVIEETPVAAAVPATAAFYTHEPVHADEPRHYSRPSANSDDYSDYHVTVIQEKAGKERNALLLGASILAVFVMSFLTIYSLFAADLGVGAIGDEQSLALLINEVPMTVEEEEQQQKEKDAGGGGGGGREDKEETSQGDLANQTKNPIIRPDARIYRTDNPNFLQQPVAATEGNKTFEKKYDRYGDPNSTLQGLSNGTGTGGGQGSGNGNGQGSGSGTGAGSGSGSGYGDGDGNGNGNGSGPGNGGGSPPPALVKVTTAYKILAKPKATYTDAARTNNVQGSVRLKIMLLASGQIGSITPVTRLPYGLTEQAIAAARQIRFEPKKVNGVPTSVVVTFDYGFNIY